MAKLTKSGDIDRNTPIYNLSLSQNEVEVLATLLARVGGNPNTTYRKYAKTIAGALKESAWWEAVDSSGYATGGITFIKGGEYI